MIPTLKLGYFHYRSFTQIQQQLDEVRAQIQAIAVLCEKYKVQAGFPNHSGEYIGALWDVWSILKDVLLSG
jgi:hypothetical protein